MFLKKGNSCSSVETLYLLKLFFNLVFVNIFFDRVVTCFVIDSSYIDPLGPAPERPRTAARQRQQMADEFDDVDVDDDLLPV